MSLSPREIAEAFSSHRFEEAFDHLAEQVVWRMPGSEGLEGREAVIAACRATAEALVDARVEVDRFVVIDGGDAVAVDTITRYEESDGASTVASCDLYEFAGGQIVQITSYTVEI